MKFVIPPKIRPRWKEQYRVIATKYPSIDLFERLDLSDNQKLALWKLQERTNPRIQQETGNLRLIRKEDMISGKYSSIAMAAFTYIGFTSRFTDGSFGIYYAGRTLKTAIDETKFHRERDASERQLNSQEFEMRAYIGKIMKPMYDIRKDYEYLHFKSVAQYGTSQNFSNQLRDHDPNAWGIVYNSVRNQKGHCIAAFRPPAVSLPTLGPLLGYKWNGKVIEMVYEKHPM